MSSAFQSLKILKSYLVTPDKFREQDHKDKACFSQGCKKYGALESWSDVISLIDSVSDNEKVFNELILENTKVKPYLDIEWFDSEYTFDKSNVVEVIRNYLKDIFSEIFDIELVDNDILFTKCHRKKQDDFKNSFHVVISTHPSIVFENANEASFLARKLREILEENSILHPSIVDLGVYKKTQNIRLPGQCKEGEFKPFELCNPNIDILEYIITNIDKNNIRLSVPEQEDNLYTCIKNLDVSDVSEHIDTILQKVKEYHPSATLLKVDNQGFIQFNYSDRKEKCFTGDNIFHDKIGFFAYVYNNLICIGCHSGRCVDQQNKKIVKIIGNIQHETKLEFQKVDSDNTFPSIEHSFIKNCIYNGAMGISNLFQKMYLEPKRIKWINDTKQGSSFFWDGLKWQQDDYAFIERLLVITVVNLLRSFNDTYTKNPDFLTDDTISELLEISNKMICKLNDGILVNNILKFVKPLIRDTDFSRIKDIHPKFLSVENGMIDLVTGELRQAVPEDNITKTINMKYDPYADSSVFDNFIREITSDISGRNDEMYNFLKWSIGYALQGQPKKKIFFILYGPHGYNGKSLLLNTICDILEYYAVTMDKSVVLEGSGKKTAGSHSTELCQLENCRLGILSDTKENSVIDDGQMKQFTSVTDKISGREIFGKQKEITPTFVPFINTNHAIYLNLSDKAMYDRFVLIPFTLSFVSEPSKEYERKADENLFEKFKNNRQGILKWLIDASLYYNQNQNQSIPECLKKAKDLYNKEINIYMNFLERSYFLVDDESITQKRSDVLFLCKEYFKSNGYKFNTKIAEKELEKLVKFKTVKNSTYYIGLKEKIENPIESDSLES